MNSFYLYLMTIFRMCLFLSNYQRVYYYDCHNYYKTFLGKIVNGCQMYVCESTKAGHFITTHTLCDYYL